MAGFIDTHMNILRNARPPLPDDIKAKGWVYRDFPKMPKKVYDIILEELGDNVQILSRAEYKHGNNTLARGQAFMCPKAFSKLTANLKNGNSPFAINAKKAFEEFWENNGE